MSAFADPAAKEVLKGLFARSVERFTLDNGLTVLHVQDSSAQLVSAQVWVRTGSIHEGPFTGAGLSTIWSTCSSRVLKPGKGQ